MKGSTTYLNWFRRLLVLGAVVAAGVITASACAVGRPPDVEDFATALHQTPAGVIADGLRLQGEAQVYQQLQDGPDAFERYASAHPYGNGLSVSSTIVARPPDVVDAAFSVGNESTSTSDGFNWSDWGIGIGVGAGIVLILGAGLLMGRQLKHRGVQTA